MKKLILLFSFFLIISCQETKKTEEPTKLSSTAEAIKNYKLTTELTSSNYQNDSTALYD